MNQRKTSICAFVPYAINTSPSQRFRVEQWRPLLAEKNIFIDFYPFADKSLTRLLRSPGQYVDKLLSCSEAFFRRLIETISVKCYDIFFIHRTACIIGPAFIERLLRQFYRKPVIFDFDDAIYLLHTSAANLMWGWLKFPGKTRVICQMSDLIIVGNNYLARYARQFNSLTTVIPSSVDTCKFFPIQRRQKGRIVIGWTGSSTSQTHLEEFKQVLLRVCSLPNVEFRVHSDRQPNLPGIPFVWRPWSPNNELDELSAFDIGIMPMPDDEWSRGKCSMKALLYMAMGIPVVCSPVGMNLDIIRHGENGYLADSDDSFFEYTKKLVNCSQLRQQLGFAGRQTVEESYSTKHCASLFEQIILRLLA